MKRRAHLGGGRRPRRRFVLATLREAGYAVEGFDSAQAALARWKRRAFPTCCSPTCACPATMAWPCRNV